MATFFQKAGEQLKKKQENTEQAIKEYAANVLKNTKTSIQNSGKSTSSAKSSSSLITKSGNNSSTKTTTSSTNKKASKTGSNKNATVADTILMKKNDTKSNKTNSILAGIKSGTQAATKAAKDENTSAEEGNNSKKKSIDYLLNGLGKGTNTVKKATNEIQSNIYAINTIANVTGKEPDDETIKKLRSEQKGFSSYAAKEGEVPNPSELYSMLPDETKNSWLKPGTSNAMKNLLSVDYAKKYVNANWNSDWTNLATERAEAEQNKANADRFMKVKDLIQNQAWNNITSDTIQQNRTVYGGLLERPEDYNDRPDEYDRELYDAYHGTGQYDNIVRSGNRKQWLDMTEEIRNLWRDVDSGAVKDVYETEQGIHMASPDDYIAQTQSEHWSDQLKNIESREKRKEEYNALIDQYGYEQATPAEDPIGQFGKGNIDLNNRKVVRNEDGSISTESSFSVNIDGEEVLLPTIIDGKRVSEDEAIRHYQETGEYLGKFATPEEADAYAQQLHERQERFYNAGNENNIQSNTILQRGSVYSGMLERPEDYNDHSEEYDRELYDAYHGEGQYDTIAGSNNRQAKLDMWEEIRNLWHDIDNGAVRNIYENGWGTNNTQQNGGNVPEEYNRTPVRGDYNPEYDKGGYGYTSMADIERGVQTNDVHRIYSFLGGGKEYQSWANTIGVFTDTIPITHEYSYAGLMTNGENGSIDEVGIFMGLYNKAMEEGREPTEAKAFLDGLQQELRTRYSIYENINVQETAKLLPVASSVASQMMKLSSSYLDIPRHIAHILGDKSTEDPNSWWYATSRQSELIEKTISDELGGVAGKTYLNFMNSASNMLRALTVPQGASGSKVVQSILSLGSFFLQVDQESTARHLQDGMGYTEASTAGALDGVFEVFEELLPFETMLGTEGVNLGLSLLLNAVTEMGQEFTGATLFKRLRGIIDGTDEEKQRSNQILNDGYYINSDGEKVPLSQDNETAIKEARGIAAKEFWQEAEENGFGGAFGGGFSGFYGTVANAIGTNRYDRKTGERILESGVEKTDDTKTRMGKEGTNTFKLLEIGEGFQNGTQTKQIADSIRAGIRAGKGVSKSDIGKLARSIVGESSERVSDVTNIILGDVFKEELQESGVKNPEKISNALVKMIAQGDYSRDTMTQVFGNNAAMKVLREYRMGKFQEQVKSINEQTKIEQAASKSVMEMLPQANDANVTADAVKQIVAGATVAATEDIKNAEGARTGNKGETVSEGKIADIAGIALKKVDVEVEGEDGTTTQQQTRWQVKMNDGREVDIADVKAVDQDVAEALTFLQNDSGKVIGQNLADAVMKIATTKKAGKSGGDMATTLSGAVRVMWAAATEQATPKISGMSAADTAAITDAVKADLEESEKKRTAAFTVLAAGKGTTTLNGVAYGTNAFNEMVNKVVRDNHLGDNVKTEAQVIGSIAKSVGAQVELYYDAEDTANQGMFTAGGGIRINLAGTTNREGAHRSALATFAHEVTHNIEANSPDAYRALRSFVFTSLGGKLNIQSELSRIQAAYAHYGEHLDIAGAVSELVAKACETVLTDESVIRQLQEQDADLAGTVGDAVNELVDRVQSIKGDALTSASMYARAMGDVSRGLSQAWMGAYKEAAAATGTTTAAGKAQASRAEYNEKVLKRGRAYFENILSNHPDINLTIISNPSSVKLDANGFVIDKNVADTARNGKYAQTVTFKDNTSRTYTYVPDLGINVELNRIGLKHGFDRNSRNRRNKIENAMLAQHAAEILQNAVEVNRGKAHQKNANVEHVMIAGVRAGTGSNQKDYAVYIVIQKNAQQEAKLVSMDIVGTLHSLNEKATSLTGLIGNNSSRALTKSPTVTLADFFDAVKNDANDIFAEAVYKNAGIERADTKFSQNLKYSISDEAYMDAVRDGDLKEAQRIVDAVAEAAFANSKMRTEDGKLRKLYHGTWSGTFTEFDPDLIGTAREGDVGFFGRGFYFAYNKGEAESYGKNVMEVYLNIQNPFNYIKEFAFIDGERADDYNATKAVFITNFADKFPELATKHKVYVHEKGKYGEEFQELSLKEFAEQFKKIINNTKFKTEKYDSPDGAEWRTYADLTQESYTNEEGETFTWDEWKYQKGFYREKEAKNKLVNAYYYMAETMYDSITLPNSTVIIMETDFSNAVKERGYDGVIQSEDGDEAVAFESSQIKLADPVVYDDNGEIIPPSERFNTTKGDIRYSISDEGYMNAVRAGDMETAQWIIDAKAEDAFSESKVRGKDGELLRVYHGTRAQFNEFRRDMIGSTGRFEGSGFNFTPYEGRAASYGGNVLSGYLNIVNPLSAEKKTISVTKLARLIREVDPTGDNIISNYAKETRDYGSESFIRRESMTAARMIWDFADNDVDIYSEISSADPDAVSLIEKFSSIGYDGLIHYDDEGNIKTAVAFSSEQFKRADPVTYDDDGNVIPLSERFNTAKGDIRYSISDNENENEITNSDGDTMAEVLTGGTVSMYSLRTWENTDLKELALDLIERGFQKKDVSKWIRDVNGIAKMIADNRDKLDYQATNGRMLKNNQEYVRTLDASTLCAKRLLYQGIYNEIQHMMPNTPLLPEDLINLINMMKKGGLVTPCGICYVESRRRMLGQYASEWLKTYDGAYKPTLEEVTTTDGLESLRTDSREDHRQAYDDFVAAMNAKGSANPKVVQLRTDYKPREIRDMSASQIQKVKDIGGLRVQSFSDFEVVHLIDMMQAVLDMAAMDLTSQAYTKVPEFAWVFGGTGIKINLSLIGKGTGVDANGNLIFDDVEGMPFEKAMELRQAYSENVGTILVGMNDEHIIAAMGDDRIDMIIHFHKSGWSKREMGQVIGMASYKDYTRFQNEKVIDYRKSNGGYKTIPNKKSKISNFNPVGKGGYWDWSHDGIWNAENYLKKCAEANRVPKFANFLIDNGDGSFRLPTESEAAGNQRLANIRKGYWKLLTDFKMYDNDGNGAAQQTVQPNFNMDRARDILDNYEGGANTLPTNHQIAQQFVDEYKQTHRRRQYSIQDEMDYDVQSWMETVPEWSLKTEAEKTLLQDFKSLRMKMQLDRERESQTQADIKKLEELLAGPTEGSVTRPETMENALEAAGVQIKPADSTKILSNPTLIKNGKVIGFIYGNDRVRVSNKADPAIFEEMGFAVDRKTKMATYVNPEGNQMGNTATKKKLEALKVKLQNIRNTQEKTREKLAQITGNEGFGGMMYRQQQVLNDLLYNKTQGEVQDSVERMQKRADAVARTIEQNQKTIAEMEKGGIVQKLKEILGTTTAEQAVRELKQMTNSTWTRNEITPLFNEIVLKMTQGQDYQQEIENLAGILVNSSRDNAALDEDLSALRGMTLVISEGQLKELKGQGSSLKEIRQRLAGTGITVKTGEYSSLTDNLDDTIAEYGPALFQDLGDEKDALENFVTRVEQRRNDAIISNQYAERLANTMAQIAAKAAGVAQGIYMPSDRTAQKQVLAMMEYVKGLAAQTQQAQKTLQGIADDMAAIQKEGRQASGMAGALARDVNVALDYYSRINQVAQQSARNQRQQAIIEQLKSKQAEKILKNNEEWRQLIARDAQARKQTEENAKTRGKINTVVKRMYNLLKNPKGTTNIPESMHGIARTVLESIVGNDLGGLKLTRVAAKDLAEISRVLRAWTERDGAPTMPTAGETSDDASLEIIEQDVQKIRDGISQYNAELRGANKVDTLKQRGEILKGIQEAMSEIYTRIRTENEVFVRGRQVQVANAAADVLEGTDGKDFREWSGFFGRKLAALHRMIVSGNMTPEYFFRTLSNNGLTALWGNYHDAENRNGLELAKSKARMAEIAEEYGYNTWDMKNRQTAKLASGNVQMTLGQIMSLWATWNREQQLGPEMSSHLTSGGFYTEEQDLRDGLLGRTAVQKKAHRVTEEDMAAIEGMLTQEQKDFVNAVVRYMSNDMSELGNEASMAAYGIKMYKENYYFPMQMWDGIKSRKSNDAAQGANVDRAFHPSFSKSRTHGANNALVIGDFMQVATDHIAGMINYATMGLANESLQKVLNYTLTEGENAEEATKRNVRARLEEAYGQEAMQYLLELQKQLNGGAVRTSKTLGDKAISLFRKNAVAGSLSVALQQPLSYIRAGMMISPKYLASALSPTNWKGSYAEMMQYSGVAVIKDMGRFDMNAGQSAREYLMPDGKESTGKKIWGKVEEYSTILPELMDRMTWTRMWSAVKAEQKAQHPEMDAKSDEFLTMCGERFNDLMRRTQVYDSVLVKSANMRNDNYWVKSLTSFMAEPTLTLNVLADSVRSAASGEKGGKVLLAKAGATFLLSAVLQAAVKGLMSSGRNPDDKKTWEENFLYRFFSSLISEADPLQLIPGFNDVITLLKGETLEDDAMGAVGKIYTAGKQGIDVLFGNNSKGVYRDIEDSVGQLAQLFTGLPMKNLMRDGRAMYNFVTQPYAERETSGNVIANQTADLFWNADNMIGVVNQWLGDAGYKTDSSAYKRRVYEAMRDGNDAAAQNYIDYMLNGKGVKSEKNIMTGTKSVTSYTLEDYQAGNITRTRADELLKTANPTMKDQDRAKKLDEIDYESKTGKEVESYSLYTPLFDAMDQGNSSEIDAQKQHLTEVGVKESTITSQMKSHIKSQYEAGEITRTQAEEQYKKYAPGMKQTDIIKALDEIDYEKETGEDVDSYSLYTRIYNAIDSGDAGTIKSQKSYLKSIGIEEKDANSQIASYISGQYKEGKLKKNEAESKLKNYAGLDANESFWTLDRIDYKKETGKDAGSGKYYRLWNAMDNNKATDIQSAINTMTSHGVEAKNIKSQIGSQYKQQYLAGNDSVKTQIRDAMNKAYKALGYSESDVNKTIKKWK